MSDEKKKSFTPFGLSWPLCLGFIIIVAAGVMTGSLSTDLAGGFAFMLASVLSATKSVNASPSGIPISAAVSF